ncbi:thiamine-phosphate diphosphorylase [Micromonospora sp. M42]|nr:thiamine-phosphate diphosphorylase [Micromonospora sp. M42]
MLSLGRLHLITDTRPGRDPLAVLRAALPVAGADLVVQVRVEDDATDREAYELARLVVDACRPYGAQCLVNDRLHVALAVDAAGGHVGADDLPVRAARRVLGPDAVLGATAREPVTARAAVDTGASYLGVGPCHVTTTKSGLPETDRPRGDTRGRRSGDRAGDRDRRGDRRERAGAAGRRGVRGGGGRRAQRGSRSRARHRRAAAGLTC